ncbi:aminotransferase class III-fold pyridoxal phosphate-dependent enzyme [Bradyrhizobium sp. 30]|uniref:aminotransferase class III-fold pyridoxal phosphate-dependent enzyme n=1 Tax=Bradyrhizobium sp. 30 TaxID=2782669 RepID=UPI0032119883
MSDTISREVAGFERKMQASDGLNSTVRSSARLFPALFSRARGSITDRERTKGNRLLFRCWSAELWAQQSRNQSALTEYLTSDAVVHGFDIATPAKLEFLQTFSSLVLRERGLKYRVQLTAPTAANAVEVALTISRKVTGRNNVVSFTRGFHGVGLRETAVTGTRSHSRDRGHPLIGVTFAPYDGVFGRTVDTAEQLRSLLMDKSTGIDSPAAVLVETVQEGGINVASKDWLRSIQAIAKEVGAIFVIDDTQMGCGRTGDCFSFEFARLSPDIVVLSKSLSGYGLPLSMLLIREDFDALHPGRSHGYIPR